MMLITSVNILGKKIIQVSGVVDYAALADFRGLLCQSIETAPPKVFLDMSALNSINADGIQIILDMYIRYSQSHDISIVNPSEVVNKLFFLTGLHNLISINHQPYYRGAY